MKHKHLNKIFFLLYITGLIICLAITLMLPYFSHRQRLIENITENATSYENTGQFSTPGHFGLVYLVYDLNGQRISEATLDSPNNIRDFPTAPYLSAIRRGKIKFRYGTIRRTREDSVTQLALIGACPLRRDGEIFGALFLIRDLDDLPLNMLGFALTWTVIFTILAVSYTIIRKKEQELEYKQRLYLAGINHELKSPITSIMALTETLMDGCVTDPDKIFYYYSTIHKEAGYLSDTVQMILELSKLQSRKDIFQKRSVSFEEIFRLPLQRYGEICEDMELQFLAPENMPFCACTEPESTSLYANTEPLPELYTNPALASRVLDLLLHNAVKFTQPGGTIQITITKRKQHVDICVLDSGCGIPEEDIPHIFERFYQAEKSHNTTGSGLGLSIVKEILDGLGEQIRVESEEGKGTSFTFTLSLAE